MKIAIGADHAGYLYKEDIIKFLESEGHTIKNFGTDSGESVDYPDHVHPLATAVENEEFELGILVCGSGNGVAITANKHQQIRAALCWQVEIAALARQHNNANVLALPARFIDLDLTLQIVKTFIETEFEGGRHARRVGKMACV